MSRIFIIGATGHVGGAILHAIVVRFPDIQVVALVRDHGKAEKVQQLSTSIETRIGDLRNLELIESESKLAQVVINASPDGLADSAGAITAALYGLKSRADKGFYIQTSGAYIIGEEVGGSQPSERVWSDISDIDSITNMPAQRYHSQTDQLVRDASSGVNVAIVAPAVVYGLSPSIERRLPITLRDIIETAKTLSMGFTMSQGKNILGYVHVEDLAQIYVSLIADTVRDGHHDNRLWGQQAYYFASNEEHVFAEYMDAFVKVLKEQNLIDTDVVKQVDPATKIPELEIVKKMAVTHGYGANVRCRGDRAANLLGLTPKGPGLLETLPETVQYSLLGT